MDFDPVSGAAGFGICYAIAHPENVAAPLASGVPSAPRAEAAALAQLLETDGGHLAAAIDCRYVVDQFCLHRHRNRARAWLRKPLDARPLPNDDLLRRIDVAARRRDAAGLITRVAWCRGHPLLRHVAKGETTELDAWGNTAVDALATEGRLVAAAVAAAGPVAMPPHPLFECGDVLTELALWLLVSHRTPLHRR